MNNSSLPILLSESFQNMTLSEARESEGIVSSIYFVINKIAEVLTNTYVDYGFWKFFIVLLAILGLISILSAIFSKACEAIKIFIKIFIFIPAIIIVNLFNKKKRKERLKAWGEFKKQTKKENKKVSKKMWIFWFIIKILLPISVIVIVVWISL